MKKLILSTLCAILLQGCLEKSGTESRGNRVYKVSVCKFGATGANDFMYDSFKIELVTPADNSDRLAPVLAILNPVCYA